MQNFPPIIFGTSALGNLYADPGFEKKCDVVAEIIKHSGNQPVFDSAGKYGAGLALESLGKVLKKLNVAPDSVTISNKLGWKRIPLTTDEPTFEPGAWVNLEYDAEQAISYDGILECFEQGNELLGDYNSRIASVHDPDEYLASATNHDERAQRTQNILDAYRALAHLKSKGEIDAIGVGSKDPQIIGFISEHITLDWAMFACSITPYTHHASVIELVRKLGEKDVKIINSAVFNAGFLIGGDHFDYRKVTRDTDAELFEWRDKFFSVCEKYSATPAAVCVQFSFLFPEIVSVALNTSSPQRVQKNLQLANEKVPQALWQALKEEKLISI